MAVDLEANQVSVESFVGGMTDFVFNGNAAEFELGDNFLLTPDEKLFTRPGSEINSATVYQIPAGNQRVGSLFSYEDTLFVQSARNVYIADSSWATITGPTSNPVFAAGTTANYMAHAYWNKHILLVNDSFAKPVKLFDNGSGYDVRTAGLPKLASAPTPSGTAGANNYVYALTHYVTYTINGVLFEDESSLTLVEASSLDAPDSNSITLSSIPVLSNGSFDNYDTTNLKIRIYRTEANQTIFYLLAEITNGTTSYVDSTADSTLVNNQTIYTTGDVVENDAPPPSKYIHVVGGIAYYGHVQENSQVMTTRIRQSVPDNPDACPETFFIDTEQEIKGLSSFSNNPIVFCESKIYRIEGFFDELGRGNPVLQEFSETIGSINHNGIVQTREGVLFPGNDGFYWTDGFQIRRISEKLINTYREATRTQAQRNAIYGTYDKKNNRVFWSMRKTTGSADNDILFVLDLRFGLRPNSCFTTWTGGLSFSPTSIVVHDGTLYRSDSRGYLLKHDDSYLTDPKIDTSTTPDNWTTQTIIYDYKSVFTNFGAPHIRKWVSRVLASLRNISNVSVQIYSHNDDSNIFVPLVEIKDTSQVVWGDPTAVWGGDQCLWDYYKLIEEERRFPSGKLRCSYKQIRITNAYTLITSSEFLDEGALDSTAKTLTLSGSNTWPAECVDYYLSFETDGYIEQYLVTDRASQVLTFDDPDNETIDAAATNWRLKGYARGEVLNLLGYVIFFSPISKTFKPYQGGAA